MIYPIFIIFILCLPVIMVVCNLAFGAFAIVAVPIIDFVESIFGKGCFEKAEQLLDTAINVVGFIRVVIIGLIALFSS